MLNKTKHTIINGDGRQMNSQKHEFNYNWNLKNTTFTKDKGFAFVDFFVKLNF